MEFGGLETIIGVLVAAAVPPTIVAWSTSRGHRADIARRIIERAEDRAEREAIAKNVESARVQLANNTHRAATAAEESNNKLDQLQAQGTEIHALVNSGLTRVQRIALKALREIVRLNKNQGIETDAETLADLKELEIIESMSEQSA
jgi:hypothetical protein